MAEIRMIETHTLLPRSIDDERAVLSSILHATNDCMEVASHRGIRSEWFIDPANAAIYRAICRMWEASKPIDIITLTSELRYLGVLEDVGGAFAVTELFTLIPSAANFARYLDTVEEKYQLRTIITVCRQYADKGQEQIETTSDLLEGLEREVHNIRAQQSEAGRARTAKEMVIRALGTLQEIYERKGQISGLSTGIAALDKATDGMHPQNLIVIAARPAHGKTALAMQIAENLAIHQQIPVGVFSLEMSADQLMQRLLCSVSRVNLQKIREGYMTERDFQSMQTSAQRIAAGNLHVEEGANMTIAQLRSRARRLHSQHGIKALFVDSLSVLRSGHKERHREVAEVVNGLKELAKELRIPVVVIAHLKRESDGSKRPRLADLRESGNIEQDADDIWFLVREELLASDTETASEIGGASTLTIAKQRMGDSGIEVPLTFLKQFTRFEPRAHEEPDPFAPTPARKPQRKSRGMENY